MSDKVKTAANSGTDEQANSPRKKGKRNKLAILGTVVAVAVAAGVGMFVWHEQPSFCDAFCHASMDAYVETYGNESGAQGVDKYGNEVLDSHAMLVVSHKDEGLACLDCHVPAIEQQVGEFMETVSGDYKVVARAGVSGEAAQVPSTCSFQAFGTFVDIAAYGGAGAVTLGTYERSFSCGSTLYHHVLDPRTGMPADTDLASATVIAASALDAEGYSTTLLALGAERAAEFACEEAPIAKAVLVDGEGRVVVAS